MFVCIYAKFCCNFVIRAHAPVNWNCVPLVSRRMQKEYFSSIQLFLNRWPFRVHTTVLAAGMWRSHDASRVDWVEFCWYTSIISNVFKTCFIHTRPATSGEISSAACFFKLFFFHQYFGLRHTSVKMFAENQWEISFRETKAYRKQCIPKQRFLLNICSFCGKCIPYKILLTAHLEGAITSSVAQNNIKTELFNDSTIFFII